MQYISLENSEYFSTFSGVSVSRKEEENWGDKIAYIVPSDFAGVTGVACISETNRMLSQIGVDKARNRICQIGTVLLQRTGHRVPRIEILRVPAVVSHYFLGVNVTDENLLLPDYVATMLNSTKEQISHFSVGSAMPYLKRETLLSMQVPLISIEEQTSIISNFE